MVRGSTVAHSRQQQDQGIGNQALAVLYRTVAEGIELDHGNKEGGHPVSTSATQLWGSALGRSRDGIDHMFWSAGGQDVT
jgi:hypothetical protein